VIIPKIMGRQNKGKDDILWIVFGLAKYRQNLAKYETIMLIKHDWVGSATLAIIIVASCSPTFFSIMPVFRLKAYNPARLI